MYKIHLILPTQCAIIDYYNSDYYMDNNILLHHLKHGENYQVDSDMDSVYQVSRAPNRYMLQAARVLEQALPQIESMHQHIMHLQNNLVQATEENNKLRTKIQEIISEKTNNNNTAKPSLDTNNSS
jgi:hypothetical protein